MDDFFDLIYNTLNSDDPVIQGPLCFVFLIPFALFIAFFHTLTLKSIYGLKKLPGYLLPILYPLLMLIAWSIKPGLSLILLFVLFILTFLLFLVGVLIMTPIKNFRRELKEKQVTGVLPTSKLILKFLLSGVLAIALFVLMPLLLPLFPLIFLLVPIILFIQARRTRVALRLQAILPTSTARSVAMGLAELEGMAVMEEKLLTPIGKKACIGYHHIIEKPERKKDGEISYRKVSDEFKCNQFKLRDETGEVKISSEKLEFAFFEEDNHTVLAGLRHRQYVLYPDQKVLIVGKANTDKGNTIFEYEPIRKVFTVFPSASLSYYNRAKPLIDLLIIFTCIFGFIAALILATAIEITPTGIHVGTPFGLLIN